MSLYQAMIVEDNAVYRQAIRTLVDWERHGFRIAAEAVNGKQALERLAAQRFDLILTDVSMPEMNGIELVKAVKENGVDAVIVMLSSYDDFQFVKDSLKLGAEDYLLKHELAPEALAAMLTQVQGKLERSEVRRSQEQARRQEMRGWRMKQWLTGDESAALPADDLAGLLPTAAYRLILLADSAGADGGVRLTDESGTDAAELIPIRAGRSALIVDAAAERVGRHGSGRAASELAERWLACGAARCGRVAAIAAGDGRDGLRGLREAYAQAEAALFLAVYDGWGRLYEAQPGVRAPGRPDGSGEADAAKRWQDALRSESGDRLAAAAAELFAQWARLKPPKSILQRRLAELYASLYPYAEPSAQGARDWWTALADSLDRLEPIRHLEEDLAAACRERFGEAQASQTSRKEIRQAIAYIREHYAEDISISDLSGRLGFSANYLSNLFRSETGLRMTEYVNRVRMEAAMHLLRDTQLKVYEVAGRVGYQDASYFCKVFKEITGRTVSAYRQQA
ncbi:response regulator [Cohnella sp. 56]|uniref:response regulator n=1 Tax=Cohnella sp. 56 TaxID=3113722 RepID=UPI0030E7EDA1